MTFYRMVGHDPGTKGLDFLWPRSRSLQVKWSTSFFG